MKKIKILFVFLIIITGISCSNNETDNLTNQLIGEWVRSDFREDFEYKLTFSTDDLGFKTVQVGTMKTKSTSSLVTFNWKISDNSITITENDDIVKTPISFTPEGRLVLKEYSEFLFNRVQK